MPQFLAAIDQGTTGSTVLIIDITNPNDPLIIGRGTVDFTQHFPKTGWVEHDLDDIFFSVRSAFQRATAQASASSKSFNSSHIIALGITNQRETLGVFDRKTSKPYRRAIVWQCKRSLDICQKLRTDGFSETVSKKTGLVIDPYFSGTKAAWIMQNDPEVATAIQKGQAIFGTVDTYLIHRLTGGQSFVTEPSNASRTLIYDIHRQCWDHDLLKLMAIPSTDCLPQIQDSASQFGKTKGLDFLPDGIPITGVLGDQQAALAGQACFEIGQAKCTYGTGAFLLLNLGTKACQSKHGLLTTVAWRVKGETTYAFEGSAYIAGAAIQFLRDQLHLIESASETAELARLVQASPDIYFVPALSGLGAPYWDAEAQGAIFGLTRGASRGQLVRAALEGIAFQVSDLLAAMNQDFPGALSLLRVDGGAAANDVLMQFQADQLGIPVDRPSNLETTAFGAAMFAGLGVKLFPSLKSLEATRHSARIFGPSPNPDKMRERRQNGWQKAIKAVRLFAHG